MKIRTTLNIKKETLGKVKAKAFEYGLTQTDLIEKYVEYCLENNIEVITEE